MGSLATPPAEERDVGRGERDVGSMPDGDPDVGLGERGGVVDAVAHHRHDLPARLLDLDDDRLLLGGDLRIEAQRLDLPNHARGAGRRSIGDPKEADQPSVERHEAGIASPRRQLVRRRLERARVDVRAREPWFGGGFLLVAGWGSLVANRFKLGWPPAVGPPPIPNELQMIHAPSA